MSKRVHTNTPGESNVNPQAKRLQSPSKQGSEYDATLQASAQPFPAMQRFEQTQPDDPYSASVAGQPDMNYGNQYLPSQMSTYDAGLYTQQTQQFGGNDTAADLYQFTGLGQNSGQGLREFPAPYFNAGTVTGGRTTFPTGDLGSASLYGSGENMPERRIDPRTGLIDYSTTPRMPPMASQPQWPLGAAASSYDAGYMNLPTNPGSGYGVSNQQPIQPSPYRPSPYRPSESTDSSNVESGIVTPQQQGEIFEGPPEQNYSTALMKHAAGRPSISGDVIIVASSLLWEGRYSSQFDNGQMVSLLELIAKCKIMPSVKKGAYWRRVQDAWNEEHAEAPIETIDAQHAFHRLGKEHQTPSGFKNGVMNDEIKVPALRQKWHAREKQFILEKYQAFTQLEPSDEQEDEIVREFANKFLRTSFQIAHVDDILHELMESRSARKREPKDEFSKIRRFALEIEILKAFQDVKQETKGQEVYTARVKKIRETDAHAAYFTSQPDVAFDWYRNHHNDLVYRKKATVQSLQSEIDKLSSEIARKYAPGNM